MNTSGDRWMPVERENIEQKQKAIMPRFLMIFFVKGKVEYYEWQSLSLECPFY
jgi:hypothetical protein